MRAAKIAVLMIMVAVMAPSSSWGFAGLLDYKLDIGDGYAIYRNNSYEVCLGKSDGTLILWQGNYDKIGPITHYGTNSHHIFARAIGLTRSLTGEGPPPELDKGKEYYFIITKGSDALVGPLSSIGFYSNSAVKAAGKIQWLQPKNPNILLPILGVFLMLVYSAPAPFMRYPLQSILVLLLLVLAAITMVRVFRLLLKR
jgi:hypothetical protein